MDPIRTGLETPMLARVSFSGSSKFRPNSILTPNSPLETRYSPPFTDHCLLLSAAKSRLAGVHFPLPFPSVPLGRPSLSTSPKRDPFFNPFHSTLRPSFQAEILVEIDCQLGPNALLDWIDHLNPAEPSLPVCLDYVTYPHDVRGFHPPAFNQDVPVPTGVGGKRSRFINANRPKPLI